MVSEYVDPDDSLVEFGIRALDDIVVQMLLIPKGIHPLEDKVEQRLQVLRTRTGHEDIGVSMRKCRRDGNTKGGRLSSSTSCSESYRRRQGLLSNCLDKG